MKPTIIIPVYNNQSTLNDTLRSLLTYKKEIEKIIIINDGSTDSSLKIINIFSKILSNKFFKIINHKKSRGLAYSYNEGITKSETEIVITMHADIILKKNAINLILSPLRKKDVVASVPIVEYPRNIWKKYSFWQKCHFSRLVGKSYSGLGGKFDAVRKDTFMKVYLFDGNTFLRAGEDGDMAKKLSKIGKIANSDAHIIHVHSKELNFGLKKYIHKNAQYAEAQGASLRKYGILNFKYFVLSFFREFLVVSLFIPKVRVLSIILIIIYSVAYTKEVYLSEYKNPKIIILPIVNTYLLFISCFYSARGFISGKQKI
ncbi:MAG: glycosyltransferase [Candidatus Shapirobacteria bacterium]|jgi:glycosyltransferase involved in cell wall biosynthesis